MVRARPPANPLFSVFGREPRAGNFGIGGPPAGFSKARFAPPSPLTLVAPSRGANSSHRFRAEGRGRPAFPRRGLLPASREPLQLRSGEQILHTNSAPQAGAGRLFQGAVCSPLPASPCSSVSGSKFFTQIPRRRPGPAAFSGARFAPRSPLTLAAPFRGAKSSHRFRAAARGRPLFPGRGLLPASREPLRLRPGEQNLHTDSASPPGAGRPSAPPHKKAPCRFIGKVLPSPQQFPAGLHSLMQIPCGAVQSPAGPSPAGHF